jgi:hypothetical protein
LDHEALLNRVSPLRSRNAASSLGGVDVRKLSDRYSVAFAVSCALTAAKKSSAVFVRSAVRWKTRATTMAPRTSPRTARPATILRNVFMGWLLDAT